MNVAISDDKHGAVRDMMDKSERKNSSTCLEVREPISENDTLPEISVWVPVAHMELLCPPLAYFRDIISFRILY